MTNNNRLVRSKQQYVRTLTRDSDFYRNIEIGDRPRLPCYPAEIIQIKGIAACPVKQDFQQMLGRMVTKGRAGRPVKSAENDEQTWSVPNEWHLTQFFGFSSFRRKPESMKLPLL